jgi:hypothetical protein
VEDLSHEILGGKTIEETTESNVCFSGRGLVVSVDISLLKKVIPHRSFLKQLRNLTHY